MKSVHRDRLWPWAVVPGLLLALYLACVEAIDNAEQRSLEPVRATFDQLGPVSGELEEIARLVAGAVAEHLAPGREAEDTLRRANIATYVGLRANGHLEAAQWYEGGSIADAVLAATAEAERRARAGSPGLFDSVEVCVVDRYRRTSIRARKQLPGNVHRGVLGIEFVYAGGRRRYAPSEMIARNLSFSKALGRFVERQGLGADSLESGDVEARAFECTQILVQLGPPLRAREIFRGNDIVEIEEVSHERVIELESGLRTWLIENVRPNGRMIYKWWPSRGEESTGNNMIRQWMASVVLGRVAPESSTNVTLRNLRYNLEHFYRMEGGLGLIELDGKVKLGAVAIAALALVESDDRSSFAIEESALCRTVQHLWQETGAFRTFYRPIDRNDNQNFYPGEALLLWATLYDESGDAALLEKIMTSFRYYRAWHLDPSHRNPAFVPWHTQALYRVWKHTRDLALQEFIFTMNDWLLGMQQWETARYPDMRGRFFDPNRPEYGPPHASSTGVYLEGLIDAYALAREVGDVERREAYRRAIVRGLRSVLQLQFVDDVDMFYVSKRGRVRGGIRTRVYDNAIRVDNVQHNLMAVLKVLQVFEPDDYRP